MRETQNLAERMEEALTRVEQIIWLPASMVAGSVTEALRDAINDDLYDGDNKQVIEKLPRLERLLTSEDKPDKDYILEALYGYDGFLVQIATPVPTSFHSGDGFSFSWGYYQTKWVHVNSMDELADIADEFHASVVKKARDEQEDNDTHAA